MNQSFLDYYNRHGHLNDDIIGVGKIFIDWIRDYIPKHIINHLYAYSQNRLFYSFNRDSIEQKNKKLESELNCHYDEMGFKSFFFQDYFQYIPSEKKKEIEANFRERTLEILFKHSFAYISEKYVLTTKEEAISIFIERLKNTYLRDNIENLQRMKEDLSHLTEIIAKRHSNYKFCAVLKIGNVYWDDFGIFIYSGNEFLGEDFLFYQIADDN